MSINFGAAFPTLTLTVDLGGSPIDISDYVRTIDIIRPSSDETGRYSPGSATFTLDNRDARFTPANTSGPYTSGGTSFIVPEMPMRLYATWAGDDYNLFCGIVEDWQDEMGDPQGLGFDSVTILTCVDNLAEVASWNGTAVAEVGADEKSGARVGRILDAAGFSASKRLLDTGDEALQATTLDGNGLDQLHHVVDSEGGAVWFEPQAASLGAVVFSSRSGRATDTRRNTAQATFSNAVISFREPILTSARERVVRSAGFTRRGGVEQTAGTGNPRITKSDLDCVSDTTTQALAEMAVAQGDPADNYRVKQITVIPVNSGYWGAVLALRMQDRATVQVDVPVSGQTINRNVFVDGISHSIRYADWQITYQFQSAAAWDGFSADVWDTGLWDTAEWFF